VKEVRLVTVGRVKDAHLRSGGYGDGEGDG
jgi:hypothetical protein